jgi:hypothetical protein
VEWFSAVRAIQEQKFDGFQSSRAVFGASADGVSYMATERHLDHGFSLDASESAE